MTETTTTTTTTQTEPATEETTGPDIPLHPSDILLNLMVAFLAPMFLGASAGDIGFARMAALETVNTYRARNQADLLSIAQIVAFGLAALGSLSLSMADNLSLSMTLRLRGNANACNRSAEQNRRVLTESHRDIAMAAGAEPATPLDAGFDEAEVVASVAAALKRIGQPQPQVQAAAPAPNPAPIAAQPVAPTKTERQIQAIWAASAATVAAEYIADLPNLPPAARRAATIRAAALSSCANDLLSGNVPPRLRPGDLAAIMRPPHADSGTVSIGTKITTLAGSTLQDVGGRAKSGP